MCSNGNDEEFNTLQMCIMDGKSLRWRYSIKKMLWRDKIGFPRKLSCCNLKINPVSLVADRKKYGKRPDSRDTRYIATDVFLDLHDATYHG